MSNTIGTDFSIQQRQHEEELRGLAIERSLTTGLRRPDAGAPANIDPTDRPVFSSPAEVDPRTSLGAAFEGTGLVSREGVESIVKAVRPYGDNDEFDAGLDLTTAIPQELRPFVDETFARNDDADQRYHRELLNAPNAAAAIDVTNNYVEKRQRRDTASASGAAIDFLGTALGATADVIATAPVALGGVAGLAAVAKVSNALVTLGIFGTAEAAAAYAERLIRAQNDATINGNTEALEAAAMAGGLTVVLGGVGAAFARRGDLKGLLARSRKEAGPVNTSTMTDDSVGAARTANELNKTLMSTTDRSILGHFIPNKLRPLKSQVADRHAEATERFLKDGNAADLKSASELDRLIGPETERVDLDHAPAAVRPSLEQAYVLGREEGDQVRTMLFQGYKDFKQKTVAGKRSPITEDEFDRLVTRIIHLRNSGVEDTSLHLGDNLVSKLSPEHQTALLQAANDVADSINVMTRSYGKRSIETGMITDEQFIENYAPITPRRGSAATEDEYYDYFLDRLTHPNETNVRERFPGVMKDGETWADFQRANPVRAREIADELDALNIQARGDKAFVRELDAGDQLETILTKARKDLDARWTARLEKLQQAKPRTPKTIAKNADDIVALEARIKTLRDSPDLDTVRVLLAKHGSTTERRLLAKAQTKLQRATKSAIAASSLEPASETARRIAKNVMAGGHVPDRLTSSAGFTKDRVIEHDVLDPRFENLFETRASVVFPSHSNQMRPRLFLHETYGPGRLEGEDIINVPTRLMRDAKAGADGDTIKRIEGDIETAEDAIRAALNQDRLTATEGQRVVAFWSQQIAKFNIASMLKMLGITQITDLALIAARGRSASTGIAGVFNAKATARMAREVRASGQPDLTSIMEGAEIMGIRNPMDDIGGLLRPTRRTLDMYGVDADEILARSELEASVDKGLDAINGAAGWLSFATPMNMVTRRAMGVDTAKVMIDDFVNFKTLSDDIKRRWFNYGVDEDIAGRVATFINGPNGKVTIEGVQFPNFAGLRQVDPQLADAAVYAANRLSGEVFPLVTPYSRPLMARTPMGRLLLQFSSFSYAVGTTVLPELKREFRHNPLGYRTAALTLGGLLASMTTLYLRAAVYGDEQLDQVHDQLSTVTGRIQFVQRAALLLPFLPGMSAQLTEILAQQIGPMANTIIGHDVLAVGGSRFLRRGENILIKAGGPTVSQISRLLGIGTRTFKAGSLAAEGKTDKATEELLKSVDTLHRMTPLIDNLPFRVIGRAIGKVY